MPIGKSFSLFLLVFLFLFYFPLSLHTFSLLSPQEFVSIMFTFFRNYFLDFDSLGHVSALEQNFNPDKKLAERKSQHGSVSVLFSGKKNIFLW